MSEFTANPVIDELMSEEAPQFNELPTEEETVFDWIQELMKEEPPEFNDLPSEQPNLNEVGSTNL